MTRSTSDRPRVRVIMPNYSPTYGGHILQMQRCLPRLQALGFEVSVVTAALRGEPTRCTVGGVPVLRLAASGPSESLRMGVFGASVLLHLLWNRNSWDVAHVVGNAWATYATVLAARLLGKRVVIEMVLLGDDDPESIARLRLGGLKLAIWQRADRIASLSTAQTDAALRAGTERERISQIPVGADTDRFRPARDRQERLALRERLGLPAIGLLVGFVGAIIERKGIALLVEAWPALRERLPEVHLILVGPKDVTPEDRAFRLALEQRTEELGLRDHVHGVGRVDDVEEFLRACDVFVLPSSSEGLPNSVLEAMATGLPPVMTDLPGIASDVIRTADEGTVVPTRTPAAFVDALAPYLLDEALRQRVGAAARRRIVEQFSIERRVERYSELYESLARR